MIFYMSSRPHLKKARKRHDNLRGHLAAKGRDHPTMAFSAVPRRICAARGFTRSIAGGGDPVPQPPLRWVPWVSVDKDGPLAIYVEALLGKVPGKKSIATQNIPETAKRHADSPNDAPNDS